LVLLSTDHLPPGWRDRHDARIQWSWSFTLSPVGTSATRLHLRTRARLAPWWVAAGYVALLVPADFVMARQMLSGIRDRAERASF
jgi:hypothetical protein